ncbi:NAD-dependent epimerase/dehydratase family protein [Pedobacter alluvionis]|uniref:NAD-dependent epimerase/dehydratase family protein n=1 Tax=Pedobacter alluvionis TaxID=475253 RepID=UPI00141AC52E
MWPIILTRHIFIRKFSHSKSKQRKRSGGLGSGSPIREFLFADDLAEACYFLMENINRTHVIMKRMSIS